MWREARILNPLRHKAFISRSALTPLLLLFKPQTLALVCSLRRRGIESKNILSPTGKPKWNREAIDKLLSNEKYTGRVLLQKTISTGAVQIENDGLMDRYLHTGTHEAIISDEMFEAVQQEKLRRSKSSENTLPIKQHF